MTTNDSDVRSILKEYLLYSSVSLDFENEIYNYLKLLIQKNLELNLISRKLDLKTIIVEHIYDSLSGFKYFEKYASITDLGSGGGFPGILLGIVFKEKKIVLIEKSPKKVIFLKDVVKSLNLKNVLVCQNLVTEIKITTECITARAFKSINEILTYTNDNSLKSKGHLPYDYLLYKGKMSTIDEEVREAKKRFKFNEEYIKIGEKIANKERYLVRIY